MMNKKTLIIIILIGGLISFLLISFMKMNQKDMPVEIEPEEEISDEQLRETMVTLYFENIENKELMPEVRMIDVKKLVEEPYKTLINLLMENPKNGTLKSCIPPQTKINNITLKSDILYIDFSKEFVEEHEGGLENEINTIYSIVNTVTELTEVNGIRILINGKENMSFKDEIINFNEVFVRRD